MNDKLEATLTKLVGYVGGISLNILFFGGLYINEHPEVKQNIRQSINSNIEEHFNSTSSSLLESSSIEVQMNGKTYTYIAFPGMVGVPCYNMLMQENIQKDKK